MATIYQRGESYYLQWHDASTNRQHRVSLGQVSEYEAETRRQDKELELRTGKPSFLFAPSDLFGVLAVRYLDWHESAFPDSHDRIKFIVEHRLTAFHHRPLNAITSSDMERWLAARGKEKAKHTGRRISAGTVAKELRTLRAVLAKGIEWQMLATNPAAGVKAPRDFKSAPPHWYTAAQLAELYAVDPSRAPIWRLMANTGLRRREAQQLKWSDVHPGELHVISRAGARTKSGKWRAVPLSPGARDALAALKPAAGEGGEYVLPKMTQASLSRAFARAAEKAGIGGSLHSLRHSFCANLVSSGVPLRTVQVLAGHSTVAVTERYAHVAPDALAGAVRNLAL